MFVHAIAAGQGTGTTGSPRVATGSNLGLGFAAGLPRVCRGRRSSGVTAIAILRSCHHLRDAAAVAQREVGPPQRAATPVNSTATNSGREAAAGTRIAAPVPHASGRGEHSAASSRSISKMALRPHQKQGRLGPPLPPLARSRWRGGGCTFVFLRRAPRHQVRTALLIFGLHTPTQSHGDHGM